MSSQIGSRSLVFSEAPIIMESASVVGTREGEGPFGDKFDMIGADDKFGQDNWEQAESNLQKDALQLALGKAGVKAGQLRYLFAGDLLGQNIASSFGLKDFQVPLFGLYGACSTCGEALSLAAMTVAAGYADYAAAVTSSHFASAEKQFRFPLEYANQRPMSATWTVTGSGAFILTGMKNNMTGNQSNALMSQKSETDNGNAAGNSSAAGSGDATDNGKAINGKTIDNGSATDSRSVSGKDKLSAYRPMPLAKITGITTGKIVDFGIKDSMNMGAAMAPAACDLIASHFIDFARKPEDYDLIVTGDLGTIGQEILFDLLGDKGYDIRDIHEDCGIRIFDNPAQGTGAGGSGCGCSAVMLSAHYLRELQSGNLKRILFVPTGALLSPVSFNEGQTVPGIAHGVVLEAI